MDDLSTLLGEEKAAEVLGFLQTSRMDRKSDSVHTFLLPAMEDKDVRRKCHFLFKKHFPYVRTSASNGSILLTVKPNRKRANPNSVESKRQRKNLSILRFTLKKVDTEFLTLKLRMARLLSIPPRSLGFAGIKDKRAITYQFGTVSGCSPEDMIALSKSLSSISIGGFRWVSEPLDVGRLWGNRFRIVLRDITCPLSQVAQSANQLAATGFVNYFGDQRFGSDITHSRGNILLGRYLLQGDWQKSLRFLLTPNAVFSACSLEG